MSEIYLFNRNGNYLRENYYSLPNDEQKAHDRYYEALFEAFSDGEPVIRHTLTEQTLYLFAPFYDQRMQVCGMFAAGIDRTALEQLLGEIDRYDGAFCVLLGADAGLSIQYNCVLPEESLVPQRQVYSTVAPLLRLLVCLIVVLVPLAAAAVSVAVWKSTKPVQAMTDKIRLFGKGELDVQMEPTGVAEYDEMAAVFNVMTGKIHSLIGQIAENQLLAAQLQIRYLQSQINPHFLFNVLTSISLEAKLDGSEELYQMTHALAQLLQGKIFRQDSIKIPLVRREGEALLIEVNDDGVGFRAGSESGKRHSHVGLHNIERLVANLYGEGYGLTIESAENRGTRVLLRLPVEEG